MLVCSVFMASATCWPVSQAMADAESDIEMAFDAVRNGDIDRAIDLLTSAILSGELDTERLAKMYSNRAALYTRSLEYDLAIEDFTEAVRLRPDRALYYYNRATAYNFMFLPEPAIRDLRQALTIDPDHAESLRRLAWILATAVPAEYRDGQEAVRLAQAAIAIEDTSEFRATIAAAYAETGDFDEAIRQQQIAISMQGPSAPESERTHFSLTLEQYRRGIPSREP